jgi:ribose-phosphate pyrophosphokinase
MIIINLDKSFTPFGEGIEYQSFTFPSGLEPHIKLPLIREDILITCRIRACDQIILLMLAVDALRRGGAHRIELFIPYLPFARQDRVMMMGEPLSVRVISDLINSLKLDSVKIFDPHSEVCLALIDNASPVSNRKLVHSVLQYAKDYHIICPDAGAYKKIFSACQGLEGNPEIILCNKVRDVTTGDIKTLSVGASDLGGKDCYIIDDICDGGGTFVMISESLNQLNCGRINLIVSHGIFSKGIPLPGISHIYTSDSFKDMNSLENFTQIKLQGIL